MRSLFSRLFPIPNFVALPCTGLDFSDTAMHFLTLEPTKDGLIPAKYKTVPLPEGLIRGGKVFNRKNFVEFLKQVKKENGFKYIRASIPETQVYSFTLTLGIEALDDLRGAIEFVLEDNIPLTITDAVFDYHILKVVEEKSIWVQVIAVQESVVQEFYEDLDEAGLIPFSFELEGQAIARAVLTQKDDNSYMIVDFGGTRTSISIITKNTVVFTSTFEFGGNHLTDLIAKNMNISFDEAETVKRSYGLSTTGPHKDIFTIVSGGISTLRDEIDRRYIYWQEKKNETGVFPNIKTIYICGGHSNLPGLAEYLSVSLKMPVEKVNPWINCFNIEEVVPTLNSDEAMSYITSIGLALTDYIYD